MPVILGREPYGLAGTRRRTYEFKILESTPGYIEIPDHIVMLFTITALQ